MEGNAGLRSAPRQQQSVTVQAANQTLIETESSSTQGSLLESDRFKLRATHVARVYFFSHCPIIAVIAEIVNRF